MNTIPLSPIPEFKFVRISLWEKNGDNLLIFVSSRLFRTYSRDYAPDGYLPSYLQHHSAFVKFEVPKYEIRENWSNLSAFNNSGHGSVFIRNSFLIDKAKTDFKWWELYYSLGGVLQNIDPPNGKNQQCQLTLKEPSEGFMSDSVFIVGSSYKPGHLSISSAPKKHTNLVDARNEAQRLARKAAADRSSTKRYIVLQVAEVVEVQSSKPLDF